MEKKETIPSYKRRLNDWDYSQPRIYMLTLAIEGRRPLLGTLVGDASQPTTASNGPRLLPSELGAAVLHEVDGIPHYYPQITIIARQLMPDHLHILLYVTRPLPVHLGQVVAGFKAGCNKKWRQMQGGAQRQDTQRGEAPWQNHWAPDQIPRKPAAQPYQAPTCRLVPPLLHYCRRHHPPCLWQPRTASCTPSPSSPHLLSYHSGRVQPSTARTACCSPPALSYPLSVFHSEGRLNPFRL